MSELEILPAGTDTALPLNLEKRLHAIEGIAGPLTGRTILDCGCGAGDYVAALSNRGARGLGFEYQKEKLLSAPGRTSAARVWAGDIQRIALPDESVDIAIVNEVLEHVPDDTAGLREVHRVLRPGGTLIVLSPNRLFPFETHGVYMRRSGKRVSHATPLIPWIPLPLGRRMFRYWARNYWPWEMRALIASAGFDVASTRYLWQTFENISGHQPRMIGLLSPLLRRLFSGLERIPGVASFGASQVIAARRS